MLDASLEDTRGFWGATQKGADLAPGSSHGVVLHGAGGGEEKEKQSPFAPGANHRRARRDGQHEKVHVQPCVAYSLPGVLGGIPSAEKVGARIKNQRERMIQRVDCDPKASEEKAARGEPSEPFPLVILLRERPVFAWRIFGPLYSDPFPKRDSGRARLLFDERVAKHLLYHHARASYLRGRLSAASRTHSCLAEVPAVHHPLCECLRDTVCKPIVIIRAKCGDRKFLPVLAESHGFEAWFLLQDSRNFANHAGFLIIFQSETIRALA